MALALAALLLLVMGAGTVPLLWARFDPSNRAQADRTSARRRRRAAKDARAQANHQPQKHPPALAVSIDGDLDDWRHGRLIIPPPRILGLPRAVIGMPGFGKSVMLEREVYLAAHAGRRVAVFDGKGSDPTFAPGIVAAYLQACPTARVGLFPFQPMDIWRGNAKAIANRLLACWAFSAEAEFYAQVAALTLRLALEAPGPPVTSSTELLHRLAPGALPRMWAGHPDELAMLKGMSARIPDVALRLANLMAALGGSMDSGWSFEDVDLAVVSVPTMAATKDADAILRILLVDYGHYTLMRKRPGEQDTLVFDEFSAIEGGRQAAIHLVERARGSGSGTILAAQSRRALGGEEEAARILHACSGGVTLFRSAEPEDVARLAGDRWVQDTTWQLQDGQLTGRSATTLRTHPKLDSNHVRAYQPGEAAIIEGGRVEHVHIIRTDHSSEALQRADQIMSAAQLSEGSTTSLSAAP